MDALSKMFRGLRIAATGLRAERERVDVIAKNIANAGVTRMPDTGEAYRREIVRLAPIEQRGPRGEKEVLGVQVAKVFQDLETPFEEVVDPTHPDADASGVVRYPNVNTVREMADLITAMRAYEANLSVQQNVERMAERALRLGQ